MIRTDDVLRRVERTAMIFCGAMAIAAAAIGRGSPWPALAVVAGGLLVGTSYWSIKSGIDGLMDSAVPREDGGARPRRSRVALQLTGRYALLAFMAYVMIVRLRLPPLGLLVGASSIVAAVAVEAVRFLTKKS